MKAKIDVLGGKELNAALKELPQAVGNRVARQAVASGARIVAAEAKRRAPVLTGALKRSIEAKPQRRQRTKHIFVANAGVFGGESPLAHLMENGTGSFYQGSGKGVGGKYEITPVKGKWLRFVDKRFRVVYARKVMHPGVRPRAFLRPAMDAKGREVIEKIGDMMGVGIEREAAKLMRVSFRTERGGSFKGNRK